MWKMREGRAGESSGWGMRTTVTKQQVILKDAEVEKSQLLNQDHESHGKIFGFRLDRASHQ